MSFSPQTQEELKRIDIQADKTYLIQYINKDYYNGEETIEIGKATATITDGDVYFTVVDPYGMEKLVMQVKVIGRERSLNT